MATPQPKRFTRGELAQFDGRDGRPAYLAYKGKVYDVSGSPLWEKGVHQDEHNAGKDLTDELAAAPHGEENIAVLPVVGELIS